MAHGIHRNQFYHCTFKILFNPSPLYSKSSAAAAAAAVAEAATASALQF